MGLLYLGQRQTLNYWKSCIESNLRSLDKHTKRNTSPKKTHAHRQGSTTEARPLQAVHGSTQQALVDERSWKQTSHRGGHGGGQNGAAPVHAKTRRARGAVAPPANDSTFEGGATATSGTASTRSAPPTRGAASTGDVGLRHVWNKTGYRGHVGRANDGRQKRFYYLSRRTVATKGDTRKFSRRLWIHISLEQRSQLMFDANSCWWTYLPDWRSYAEHLCRRFRCP